MGGDPDDELQSIIETVLLYLIPLAGFFLHDFGFLYHVNFNRPQLHLVISSAI